MKKNIKKELRAWLILGVLQLTWVVPVAIAGEPEQMAAETEAESTEDLTQWKEEPTEVFIEEAEVENVTEPMMVSLGEFKLTAYCPCKKCTDGDGITATGTVATQGRTVAVDPKIIPYGTVLVINGQEYVAEDNGIGEEKVWIQGNEIDVFFDDHEEAWEFGIQYAEVFTYVFSSMAE